MNARNLIVTILESDGVAIGHVGKRWQQDSIREWRGERAGTWQARNIGIKASAERGDKWRSHRIARLINHPIATGKTKRTSRTAIQGHVGQTIAGAQHQFIR